LLNVEHFDTLLTCMGVTVATGRTKSPRDVSLVSLPLKSDSGEHVCFLMQVHAKSKDAKTLEKECSTIIQHSLLETEGDVAQRLDGTLKELNGLLKGMFLAHSIDDVHMLIAALGRDGALHVSHAGRAEAYVVRGGSTSQITEYTKGKATPSFVHIASGGAESRDIFVFSTQRLLRSLTPAQLSKIAQRHMSDLMDALIRALETEDEHAAFATFAMPSNDDTLESVSPSPRATSSRRRRGGKGDTFPLWSTITSVLSGVSKYVPSVRCSPKFKSKLQQLLLEAVRPERKRKTHFLLLAGVVAVLLIVWATVQLSTSTQRGKARADLKVLVEEIDEQIRSADNRRLAGDSDAANAILRRAQEQAKQVMDNDSGLFRVESLDLLDRIRSKREEINNIIRLTPRTVVALSSKNPSIISQGLIGVSDGEFIVYDKQDTYRVLLNNLDEPDRLSEGDIIDHGVHFSRYQTNVFLMADNSVIETISGQPTSMKTEDSAGWIKGKDLEAYLRYLYILSPENNQIYKYERLSNRYGAPVAYNVNGDVKDAIDMTVDGNVYLLKEGGDILKLLRGEVHPFVIRRAPDGVLETATKIFKSFDGNFYFLDPENSRVIIATDGGATGESTYIRQYVLEGDQIGDLKDLYVDPDDTRLYVLDDKRLYVIDL
jgi:hypothetical protein